MGIREKMSDMGSTDNHRKLRMAILGTVVSYVALNMGFSAGDRMPEEKRFETAAQITADHVAELLRDDPEGLFELMYLSRNRDVPETEAAQYNKREIGSFDDTTKRTGFMGLAFNNFMSMRYHAANNEEANVYAGDDCLADTVFADAKVDDLSQGPDTFTITSSIEEKSLNFELPDFTPADVFTNQVLTVNQCPIGEMPYGLVNSSPSIGAAGQFETHHGQAVFTVPISPKSD